MVLAETPTSCTSHYYSNRRCNSGGFLPSLSPKNAFASFYGSLRSYDHSPHKRNRSISGSRSDVSTTEQTSQSLALSPKKRDYFLEAQSRVISKKSRDELEAAARY